MNSSTRIQRPEKSADVSDIESQHATQNPLESEIMPEAAVMGYLNLSATMASNDSLAIFRRFGDLNMLNLLCLQAELTNLRAEFLGTVSQSANNDPYSHGNFFKNKSPIDFSTLIEDGPSPQREVFEKIRTKLKEYNSRLLEAAQMKKMQPPDDQILSLFRHWLAARPGDIIFREPATASWDKQFSDDLVLLSEEAAEQSSMIHDFLYKGQELLSSAWRVFLSRREREEDPSTTHIWEAVRDNNDKVNQQIAFANRMVMALFGGVTLIIPVLIMAFHPTRNTCLVTTSVATLLFALILAFEARDSRGKDVLTATAAYAAVLVVFIGTALSGSPLTANTASSV